MHAWEAIQKTLDYIEANIGEELEIGELAEIASLSPFYYQRLFTRLVKKPLREYIKLRRLARARDDLLNKRNRIIDVAAEYGFGGHETFTRAFKEAFGLTPAQFRDKPVGLMKFDKPDLLLNYVMTEEGVPLISDGFVLEINRKVLDKPLNFTGLKGHFPFTKGKMRGDETGVEPFTGHWKRFHELMGEIPNRIGVRTVGVYYQGDAPEGLTTHFVGAETSAPSSDPRFEDWLLPAREYVVCGAEAEDFTQLSDSVLSHAMKYTRTWLRNHGLIADGFFPELYYNDPVTAYMELWIPFKQRDK